MTTPKVVLITGATSGIGFELAKRYEGSQLILLGRKALTDLKDPIFQDSYCQCDLAHHDCTNQVKAFLETRNITHIDLLIHNAAQGYYGAADAQADKSFQDLLHVNLYAPIMLSHSLLPYLEAASGRLVFISSIAADLPVPDYAVYGASKKALSGFANNLRLELGTKVKVQVIYPGATRTDMHRKSGVPKGSLKTERFPSASLVAQQIHRAIKGNRANVSLGFSNALMRFLGRYASKPLDWLLGFR